VAQESLTSLDTIRDLRKREPFSPFVVVMTSGDRCVIEDPEGLAISSSQLHYYPPRSNKAYHLRLSQIALVEENASNGHD
jgi:hypothetical protein